MPKSTKTARAALMRSAAVYSQLMEACAAYVAVTRPKLCDPLSVYRLLAPLCKESAQESFFVVLLNTRHNLIGVPIEVTRGILDSCPVHPREVFRPAIAASAFAIIIAHNHPGGDPTPSQEDIEITRRLVEAGQLLGIPVYDSLVIGVMNTGDGSAAYVSLRERGLVNFNTRV